MMRAATAGPDRAEGFALLAVLWVIVGIAALGVAASLAGREAVATAVNRADLARAAWLAEDCVARARGAITEALAGRATDAYGRPLGWEDLDRVVPAAALFAGAECDVAVRPAGATLDVNAADGEALRSLFAALGVPAWRADSLADAVLDWRDADAVPRPAGAEEGWYLEQGRHAPRNGALADPRELRRIRGLEDMAGLEAVLGVEPGRVSLKHAPPAVLATLPGFGPEAVQRVIELRGGPGASLDLPAVAAQLPGGARRRLLARFADAARASTVEPDAWIVIGRGRSGAPPVTAVVEVRLVRAGARAAIVRRRVWLE